MALLVFFLLFIWFIVLLLNTVNKRKQSKPKPIPQSSTKTFSYPIEQPSNQHEDTAQEEELPKTRLKAELPGIWRERASTLTPVVLDYVDSKGDRTEREVDITHFSGRISDKGAPDLFLEGFCHLRNGRRTFVASRARRITIIETGEIFTDPTEFGRYLIDQYLKSDEGRLDKFFGTVGSDLTEVAIYLGRLEGRLKPRTKKVLTPILADLAGTTTAEMNDSPIYKEVRKAAGYNASTYKEACISLRSSHDENTKRLFKKLLEDLSVDGRGKPDEVISAMASKILKKMT